MIFDSPLLLFLAPVAGLIVAALAWWVRRRRIQLAGRWSAPLAARAARGGRWSPLWLGLAALLAAVALAGPRGGSASVRTESEALSVVLVVDVSKSMLAEDTPPSRLDRALREARRLVQDLSGDRVGLIAFAGRSYILAPVTVDGRAVMLHLDALDAEVAGTGGSLLSAALDQGGQLLEAASEVSDRVLVVFTDGESHDDHDAAVAAAARLRRLGVRLVLVPEGTTAGAQIPVRNLDGTVVEYQKDEGGQVVTTRRDDLLIRDVADAAEGTIVPAEVPDQAGAVRELLAAFKRSPTRETQAADLLPLGWIPALAAGLLLLLHAATRSTAALAAIAWLLLAPAPAVAQEGGEERRSAEADGWLRVAARGVARDTAWYNAGTAALAAGRLDVALDALGQAAGSLDPALRYRALYNRGVAGIFAARGDSAGADSLLAAAVRDLRGALVLEPASDRAKWNLELATRRRPPPPPSGGGGGAPPPPTPGQPPPPTSLSPAQAQQLLNSVEREERRVRERQLKRLPGEPVSGGRDW